MKLKGSTLFTLAVIIFFVIIPLVGLSPFYIHIFQWAMIWIIWATSFRLLATTGQLSLAHGAFMTIGGYTSAILTVDHGWNPWAAVPIGCLICVLVALPVGIAGLRLGRLYLIMLTAGIAEVIKEVLIGWRGLTHGRFGIPNIPELPPITIFGHTINFFGVAGRPAYYYLTLIVMLICLLVMSRMESGRLIQLTDASIRHNAVLAKSVGIKTARYKIMAFLYSAMFASICGSLAVHYYYFINPDSYIAGVNVVIYTLGGGSGQLMGPVIGTLVFSTLPDLLRVMKAYQPMIYGIILIVVITLLPGGLISLPARLRRRFRKKEEYVPPAWY